MSPRPTEALARIRVLELASYITGPYAAQLLADLGADVIKVEDPNGGDHFRRWGDGLYAPTFCAFNRNKRSVALDLRSPAGRAAALGLAGQVDVLVENFRPGVMERLGLGYATLAAANPRLIYCSITGFGADGPYAARPGYDTLGQATSGLLGLLTDLEQPQGMGVALADHVTGIYACYGILGALVARERTGQGQRVETSLLQAAVSFVNETAARYFASGQVPTRKARTALAQVYAVQAGDGLPFVIHLSSPPKFWQGLTAAIGRPELRDDARFARFADRERHYDALAALLAEVFATDTRAAWLARLQAQDVPCAPINRLDEVFADPQVQHLGLQQTVAHPRLGASYTTANPVRLSATPVQYRTAPPLLGEHTDAVLREFGLRPGESAAAHSTAADVPPRQDEPPAGAT